MTKLAYKFLALSIFCSAGIVAAAAIQLPIEVIGPNGMTTTVSFNIPLKSNLNGPVRLWMQIHGLRSQSQASIQLNSADWAPITESTVTLLGNASAYGGIGGGFSTLTMTKLVPLSSIQIGANTMSFRFNGTDGRVSGFRVLAFNFLDSNGIQMLPGDEFVKVNPSTWQPPSTLQSDISAGQALWRTAALTTPTPNGPTPILAHCMDCHAQDGRDLKYFNYSNNSIETRAMFHGLTAQQGMQIASYIRSLNVVNPGRPWNPPYQPGPGLDSQPAINWAAGAGLGAVVNSDADTMNDMFPNGVQDPSVYAATGNLNQREIRRAFQLPDWNQWLPGTSPMDAWGSAFTNSTYNSLYQTIRANLNVGDPISYVRQASNLQYWTIGFGNLWGAVAPPNDGQHLYWWTPQNVDKAYSLPLWGMVKTWEIMNEFQLEGFAQNIFGPQADPRAWYSALPFAASPFMLTAPAASPGLRNGKTNTRNYLNFIWFEVQLILNDSNKKESGSSPIDWSYGYGIVNGMSADVQPQAALQAEWLIKALQITNNGNGPNVPESQYGWAPYVDLTAWVTPESYTLWQGVSPATRTALSQGLLQAWFNQVNQFTPQQLYAGGWANPSVAPNPSFDEAYIGGVGDKLWYVLPVYRYLGVSQTLIYQIADWAQIVWPGANWSAVKTASCSVVGGITILCSTEK
jgi:hypothetical protein